ncbi:MAG: hypothetical protein LAT62_01075 [Natronospirillum sp.]|uniref:hypothetical protein n=1 Tax=Natronospirillum sp. TaxID=2812955 RepID=UPI0025D98297|nr:hypothetical protein [Natronospirillum sp.]MCH8550496.1 hypothetical protein [Natronospirillum sp.]
MQTETQLKCILGLYFLGAFTLVLWIPAGLWSWWLYRKTGHHVAKAGTRMFWQSWIVWIVGFLIFPFFLTPLMIMVPALIVFGWAGWIIYRCARLLGDLYVTPM